jgi:tetratricopeptide (TPR) repeat protein
MSRKIVVRLLVVAAAIAVVVGGYFLLLPAPPTEKQDALAHAEHDAPDVALPIVQRNLDKEPNDPELLRAVVRLMERTNAPPPDLEPFTARWVVAAPKDPAALRVRMEVLQKLKRIGDAIEPGERLLELTPDDQDTRLQLAQCYLAVGRYEEAARETRRLLDHSSFPADELLVCLARVESARGNDTEAARLLDRVLMHDPSFTSALLMRGIVYQQMGDHAKAVAVLKQVKPRSAHERVIVLHHLGQALARSGQAAEAQKAFDELVIVQNALGFAVDARVRPKDVAMQVRAARTLLAAGWAQDGAELLEGALDRLGANRDLLLALADCYEQLGGQGKAQAIRNQASRLP